MSICHRLFVVPMANDAHGKSTIIRSMVSQAQARRIALHHKGRRSLTTVWGRKVDAFTFGRSYQEVEKGNHGSVVDALDGNDAGWRERDLIVMPSHVAPNDIADAREMIDAAHSAGFDAIAAPVICWGDWGDNRAELAPALALGWDKRWSIHNPWLGDPAGQLWALGNDLWAWISAEIAR